MMAFESPFLFTALPAVVAVGEIASSLEGIFEKYSESVVEK